MDPSEKYTLLHAELPSSLEHTSLKLQSVVQRFFFINPPARSAYEIVL